MTADVSRILTDLADANVRYVRFELPDLHGISRSKTIPIGKVEDYARRGLNLYGGTLGLDSASLVVPGCGLNEEQSYADSLLFPDFDTFQAVPWKPGVGKVICNPHFIDGRPMEQAPRRVLARLLERAAALGFDVTMGHEFEFYLLDGRTREPLFQGLHIFNSLLNDYSDFFTELLDQLQRMGIDVITHNCEYAGSQFEINFGAARGLAAADKAFTFKNAVKEFAHRSGYHATFMSKPWPDRAGCGCHVHMGLIDRHSGRNAMLDSSAPQGLSSTARGFVAGILAHAEALCALCNPTPNCYHRLKPHTFAPSNISWGIEDRSALVRVKATGDEHTHVEMRGASGLSNPYLSAAAVLASGLLGIEQQLEPPPAVSGPSEDDASLQKLPASLEVALEALAGDRDLRALLGQDFIHLFSTVKRFELQRFRSHISDWERNEYLTVY